MSNNKVPFKDIQLGQYFMFDDKLWVRTFGNNAVTKDLRSFYLSDSFGVVPISRPLLDINTVNKMIFEM